MRIASAAQNHLQAPAVTPQQQLQQHPHVYKLTTLIGWRTRDADSVTTEPRNDKQEQLVMLQ